MLNPQIAQFIWINPLCSIHPSVFWVQSLILESLHRTTDHSCLLPNLLFWLVSSFFYYYNIFHILYLHLILYPCPAPLIPPYLPISSFFWSPVIIAKILFILRISMHANYLVHFPTFIFVAHYLTLRDT